MLKTLGLGEVRENNNYFRMTLRECSISQYLIFLISSSGVNIYSLAAYNYQDKEFVSDARHCVIYSSGTSVLNSYICCIVITHTSVR